MGSCLGRPKPPRDEANKAGKQESSTRKLESQNKSAEQNTKDAKMLIAVVGRTGSGLSQALKRIEQFIHDVTGTYQQGVAPAASLQPYTTKIQEVETLIKSAYYRRQVTMIDTPGFDYSRNNDEHTTFKQLARYLRKRYGSKVRLDGVIYMHNIWNEELYNRPTLYTSDPLEQLCGHDWRKKIIFVNSHWDEGIGDDGEEREDRLKKGYWNYMIRRGSKMLRYWSPGDKKRAQEILEYLIDPHPLHSS